MKSDAAVNEDFLMEMVMFGLFAQDIHIRQVWRSIALKMQQQS